MFHIEIQFHWRDSRIRLCTFESTQSSTQSRQADLLLGRPSGIDGDIVQLTRAAYVSGHCSYIFFPFCHGCYANGVSRSIRLVRYFRKMSFPTEGGFSKISFQSMMIPLFLFTLMPIQRYTQGPKSALKPKYNARMHACNVS